MLGHKTSLSKFKTEIIPSIFSDHNTMRLDVNYKVVFCAKKHEHVEAKQYAAKQPMDHCRNQRGIKKYLKATENENNAIQNLQDVAKAVLRGKFIVIQTYLRKLEKSQTNFLYT